MKTNTQELHPPHQFLWNIKIIILPFRMFPKTNFKIPINNFAITIKLFCWHCSQIILIENCKSYLHNIAPTSLISIILDRNTYDHHAVLIVLVHYLCVFVEVGVVQVICNIPGYEGCAFGSGHYDGCHFIGS